MPSVPKYTPIPIQPLPAGKRIAQLRKSKGLTQQELAGLMGLSQKQITDYETGKAHLSDEMIVRFSIVLGVSSDHLLGLKDIDIPHDSLSLRFARRIKELEKLPEQKKKVILHVLDDFIRANT